MMGRIEDGFNDDHRSNIFVTGTMSVVVTKPALDNKMMNANYFKNIRSIEGEALWNEEQRLIEEEKAAKDAERKKPAVGIRYEKETNFDVVDWHTVRNA
jgi:hypothetical protein